MKSKYAFAIPVAMVDDKHLSAVEKLSFGRDDECFYFTVGNFMLANQLVSGGQQQTSRSRVISKSVPRKSPCKPCQKNQREQQGDRSIGGGLLLDG